jgi:hypothetical protein
MNSLIQKIVDETAEEIPGVYHIDYESGKSGVEFTNEALHLFVSNIAKECFTSLYRNPESSSHAVDEIIKKFSIMI